MSYEHMFIINLVAILIVTWLDAHFLNDRLDRDDLLGALYDLWCVATVASIPILGTYLYFEKVIYL